MAGFKSSVSLADRHYGEFKIADNAVATTIRGTSQWQAITTNVVTGITDEFTYLAGVVGAITATSTGAGASVTITCVGHGLSAGQWITQNGMSDISYNGVYEVITAPTADTFTITETNTTASETGFFQRGASLTATIVSEGNYKGHWASCGISAVNAHVFDFAPYVNGVRNTSATARRKFSNADYGSFSGTGLAMLSVGDVLWFAVQNITGTGDLTMRALNVNIHRL